MMGIAEAATAIGGGIRGGDAVFNAVNTDSRSISRGDLFVALKGERVDGHRFVERAAAAGAVAAMVEEAPAAHGLPLLIVKNTRRALGQLAAYWRSKFTMPLVAVTGSSGKTTVKEMLAGILRESVRTESETSDSGFGVHATRGNLNNDIGVPLMLLELRPEHRYAVIEMGMNHAGEIRYLTQLAAPDIALVNNAGHAHIEYLGSEEAIARAKGEIFEGLKTGGTAVINADERFAALWRGCAAGKNQLEFGIEQRAAVSATYRLHYLKSEIVVQTPRGKASATLGAAGLHNVRNALAASAAAAALAIAPDAIGAGLSHFPGVKGRLQKMAGMHGATLIDDTYNANPQSARAAIAVLARAPGRTLLVLGDMGELGADAPALHADVGTYAREAGVGRMFALGEHTQLAVRAFGKGATHFPRIEELLSEIDKALAPDVTLLVKGSRFMQMERIVKAFTLQEEAKSESREESI
jgi:UDP-N-acetylmuramoyl-tripeptide--D-alanyl-D-alanine ligase